MILIVFLLTYGAISLVNDIFDLVRAEKIVRAK